jgi:hypothetical protein
VSRGLLLGRKRCTAEITVATRSLLGRTTKGETVWCVEPDGHYVGRPPTNHRGVATQLKRRPLTVVWEVRHGHPVLLEPDSLVEVP